jgi:hypothetical protein
MKKRHEGLLSLGDDGWYEAFPFLFLVHVKIDGIRVGRGGSRCFFCGRGPIATLWTTASGNKADRCASLAFQLSHGICAILDFFALFAFLGLLASGNCLRCNEVDIGTAESVSKS